jgi:hypothetical protein
MSLINDEKRGNWVPDLAALSNQIWNRQQSGNPGLQQTGTNNFANLELIWLTGAARPANRAARSLRRSLRARFARRPHGHPQSKRHQPQFKG